MNLDEAAQLLGISSSEGDVDVERRYQELYSEFQVRLTNAPTQQLKKMYSRRLQELEEARDTLLGVTESTESDLPTDAPVDRAGTVRASASVTTAEPSTTRKREKSSPPSAPRDTQTTAAARSRIFISYRREDSAGHVLALLRDLREHFGADRIFKDTDSIAPGQDFVSTIEQELASCSVLLAIIGKEWLTVQDPRAGRRRLDNPEDFLRQEVATALGSKNILVIPVLVRQASMPAAEDLPLDLASLARRNAIELSDTRWDSDLERLIRAIEKVAGGAPAKVKAPPVKEPGVPETTRRGQSQGRELLEVRRKRQIDQQLKAAREAFEAGEFESAILACDNALFLDPREAEALELSEKARRAIDQQKLQSWLTQARSNLAAGKLGDASELIDQALLLDPALEEAVELRQELMRVRAEQERERERSRLLAAALERMRASYDEEDFEATIEYAEDALALRDDCKEAIKLRAAAKEELEERRRQRETKRRAQQAVADARRDFAAGQQAQALASLEAFSPKHALVSQTLDELRTEWNDIQKKRDELDRLVAGGKNALAANDFSAAAKILDEAARIAPERNDIADLLAQAELGQQEAYAELHLKREMDEKLADVSEKLRNRDFDGARRSLDEAAAVDRHHPDLGELDRRIDREQETWTALEIARACFDRNDFDTALKEADRALAIDPTLQEARQLKERALTRQSEVAKKVREDAAAERAEKEKAKKAEQKERREREAAAAAAAAAAATAERESAAREAAKRELAEKAERERALRAEEDRLQAKRLRDEELRAERDRAEKEKASAAARIAAAQKAAADRAAAEQAAAEQIARERSAKEQALRDKAAADRKRTERVTRDRVAAPPSQVVKTEVPVNTTSPAGVGKTDKSEPEKPWLKRFALPIGGVAVAALAVTWLVVNLTDGPPPHDESIQSDTAALAITVPPPAPDTSAQENAVVVPPAPAPDTSSRVTTDDRRARVRELIRRGDQQRQSGNQDDALATYEEAYRLDDRDAKVRSAIDAMMSEALALTSTARSAAVQNRASDDAHDLYSSAVRTETIALGYQQSRRTVAAIRMQWRAADSYKEAADAAKRTADARRVANVRPAPAPAPAPPAVIPPPAPSGPSPEEIAATNRRRMEGKLQDAVSSCVNALRSKNPNRIASLYAGANLEKVRRVVGEAQFSVNGDPRVSAPNVSGESATQDFMIRVSWRRFSGAKREAVVQIRAEVSGNDSPRCHVLGSPDL